ncbi:hypothetical protein D9Q98_003960 [Chlorella vulgaris]|uniref:Uncharacterized protein n=1 Tax=Chlorella vulgaris TaxID=3077 RepID=A0A9D4TRD3_CHLVU|nr:hypothetical protein D9Q98_003960 [Chlorella vulgaris]
MVRGLLSLGLSALNPDLNRAIREILDQYVETLKEARDVVYKHLAAGSTMQLFKGYDDQEAFKKVEGAFQNVQSQLQTWLAIHIAGELKYLCTQQERPKGAPLLPSDAENKFDEMMRIISVEVTLCNDKKMMRLLAAACLCDNPRKQATALEALNVYICQNKDRQAYAAEAGAMSALMKLLGGHNAIIVQAGAAGTIRGMMHGNRDNQDLARDEGVVQALVTMLGSIDDTNGQKEAAWALFVLADGNPDNKAAAARENAVRALVPLLESSVSDVVDKATWALGELANGNAPNQNAFRTEGAFPKLKLLLDSRNGKIVSVAAWALGVIAMGNLENLAAAGDGIAALVRLLGRRDNVAQLNAARTIGQLVAGSDSNRKAANDAGAVDALRPLLQSGEPNVQDVAVATMSYLQGVQPITALRADDTGPAESSPGSSLPSARECVAFALGCVFALAVPILASLGRKGQHQRKPSQLLDSARAAASDVQQRAGRLAKEASKRIGR